MRQAVGSSELRKDSVAGVLLSAEGEQKDEKRVVVPHAGAFIKSSQCTVRGLTNEDYAYYGKQST